MYRNLSCGLFIFIVSLLSLPPPPCETTQQSQYASTDYDRYCDFQMRKVLSHSCTTLHQGPLMVPPCDRSCDPPMTMATTLSSQDGDWPVTTNRTRRFGDLLRFEWSNMIPNDTPHIYMRRIDSIFSFLFFLYKIHLEERHSKEKNHRWRYTMTVSRPNKLAWPITTPEMASYWLMAL